MDTPNVEIAAQPISQASLGFGKAKKGLVQISAIEHPDLRYNIISKSFLEEIGLDYESMVVDAASLKHDESMPKGICMISMAFRTMAKKHKTHYWDFVVVEKCPFQVILGGKSSPGSLHTKSDAGTFPIFEHPEDKEKRKRLEGEKKIREQQRQQKIAQEDAEDQERQRKHQLSMQARKNGEGHK